MQHRLNVVLVVLALGLSLSGCMGTMGRPVQRGQNNPLGTATPGNEPAPGVGSAAQNNAADAAGGAPPPAATADASGQPAAATPLPADQPAPVQPTTPPAVTPTVNPAFANVQIPTAADLEQRWRAMQVDRRPFDQPRNYFSPGYQLVWWFDPIFGQLVPVGQLQGEFAVQATFRIKGNWVEALEIPLQVNQQYGITVPPEILKRMQAAGKSEWAEVFVYLTRDMEPR